MRFESYAQELEDLILYLALQDVENGFYIDIGANDPTDLSVTKFFYLRGWHGINVEPLTDKCLLLEEQRPRDLNLCVGISNRPGKLSMYEAGTGTTFLTDVAKSRNFESNRQTMKSVITMTELYRRYCTPDQPIHFCKIDVEGYEKEVLESIEDWQEFRPWIYAVESTEPGTTIPCHEKWEHLLLDHDYLPAFTMGINRYYLDVRKEHLLSRFGDEAMGRFLERNSVAILKLNFLQG